MSARARILAFAVLASLGAAGAVGPRLAREKVRAAAALACERRAAATCTVGSVDFALDGLLLRDVRASLPEARRSITAARVAVRLRWSDLALGRSQSVDVQVAGVEVRGDGALRDLLHAPARTAVAGEGRRRLTLGALHVERIQADIDVHEPDMAPAKVQLREGALEVTEDRRVTARWSELRVEAPRVAMRSGGCVALLRPGERTLNCSGFEAVADVRAREALPPFVERVLGALEASRSDVPSALSPDSAAALGESTYSVQAREGILRVERDGEDFFRFAPAAVSLQAHGRVLDELRVDVGDDTHAAMNATYTRSAQGRWSFELDAATLPLQRLAPWVPFVPWHATEHGTARVHVRVEPREGAGAAESVDVSGNVRVEGFGLQHPGLAREPLDGLTASLSGRATLDFAHRRVTTPGISAELNGLRFSLAGSAERTSDHTAVDATLRVPSFDCDLPRQVLPPPAVGPVAGFLFSGTLGGDAHIALDTRRLGDTVLDVNVLDGCQVSMSSAEVGLRRLGGPFIQRVQEPNDVLRAFLTGPGTPAWTPFESISPFVAAAVVQREDGGFYRHHGFSPDEIRGALVRNINAGRFAYGASTITMQLVKNVFLAREKTLVRKLQEVALTWWIERSLDKRAILELYLNVVEFGPGIYGIGPAARFFFGCEPANLTLLQSIYLATLLPAPVPRYAMYDRGAVGNSTLGLLRRVAHGMAASHLIEPAAAEGADHEGISFRPRASPVPQPQTITVDPLASDDQAADLAQRYAVQVRPADAAPSPDTSASAPPVERDDDDPR